MQPRDHMSTGVLYSGEPNRISGARYSSVTTCAKPDRVQGLWISPRQRRAQRHHLRQGKETLFGVQSLWMSPLQWRAQQDLGRVVQQRHHLRQGKKPPSGVEPLSKFRVI